MKTQFGRELAKIRIENNMSLKDMAAGLDVPSSYLSAVEANRKSLTSEFLSKIMQFLSLAEDKEDRLRGIAMATTGECNIDTTSLGERHLNTLAIFARRVADISDGDMEKIRQMLKQK